MDGRDLERLALRHLPSPFLRGMLKAVFVGRRLAYELCQAEFAPAEADNVRGYCARGKIEGLMRDVADRHNLESEVLKQPGQPWNHTEIRSGQVVLTASAVPTPLAMVEPAEYRRGLAETGQSRLALFDEADVPSDASLYVIVIHSPYQWATEDERREFAFLPGSAHLVFPASDMECYVHNVDLFEMYPDIVREHTPREWDEEALVRYLERSRRRDIA